jgi:phosphopantothenoylcysteine decarboxylase/phosphopantothenate--cysteine ligase
MRGALSSELGLEAGADAVVMCAAVSDYRPRDRHATKLKRVAAGMTLELVQNPDLLAELARTRRGARPYLLGFAVETLRGPALIEAARRKLERKGCDAIVANAAEDALGGDDTHAWIVSADQATDLGAGSKRDVARALARFLASRLEPRAQASCSG